MSSKNFKRILFTGLLLSLGLSLSACSVSTTSNGTTTSLSDGNIFLSLDKGANWREINALPTTTGKIEKIADVEVNGFFYDPTDSAAVYLATRSNGLYFTYGISRGWTKALGLPEGKINAVSVDPKNKCVIYAATANKLYRSADCARSFSQVYYDNTATVSVNTVVIDSYNPKNVYIGTSRGEVIKSIDAGLSWRTIYRLDEGVARLVLSSLDSRLIFLATEKNKVFSFFSNTNTDPATSADIDANFLVDNFTDLNAVLKDSDLGSKFVDLLMTTDGTLFLATGNVIMRSEDSGITWESLKLIQPDGDAIINALAVNPQNTSEIYYVTTTTFFRSIDGGVAWTTKRLPTGRVGSALLVDFKNANNVYLGAVKPVKK